MAQLVSMIRDPQEHPDITDARKRRSVSQNKVLAFLADSMIAKGIVLGSPPPRDYRIPKQPVLDPGRRSGHRADNTYNHIPHRYGDMEVSPPSSGLTTPPSSEPPTPSSTSSHMISPRRKDPYQSSSSRFRTESPETLSREEARSIPANPPPPPKRIPSAARPSRKDNISSIQNDPASRIDVKSSVSRQVEDKRKTVAVKGKRETTASSSKSTPTKLRLQFELESPHTQILTSRHRANKPVYGHISSQTEKYLQDAHLHSDRKINIISVDLAEQLGWRPDSSQKRKPLYTAYGEDATVDVVGAVEIAIVIPGRVELRKEFDFQVCERGHGVVLPDFGGESSGVVDALG